MPDLFLVGAGLMVLAAVTWWCAPRTENEEMAAKMKSGAWRTLGVGLVALFAGFVIRACGVK